MASLHVASATVICPEAVTGGPKALHQLAYGLNRMGINTEIAYYGSGARIGIGADEIVCEPLENNRCLRAYAEYEPRPCERATLGGSHLVVLPEVRAGWALAIRHSPVVVWWLTSVALFSKNAIGGRPDVRERLFADERIVHLSTSHDTTRTLQPLLSGRPIELLSDYTPEAFTDFEAATANPDTVVGFNSKKGDELAERFSRLCPDVPLRPIEGLLAPEVPAAMRKLRAYVEFSAFPGRECMPREAAASGAVVFVRRIRSGSDPQDYPLDESFKFDDSDASLRTLGRQLQTVLAEPEPSFDDQASFRAAVRGEKQVFEDQLRRLFSPITPEA